MPKIQYKEINFRGKSLELINLVNQVINEYKNQGYELTLRQTYYQLVARGYIPNNERTDFTLLLDESSAVWNLDNP